MSYINSTHKKITELFIAISEVILTIEIVNGSILPSHALLINDITIQIHYTINDTYLHVASLYPNRYQTL